MSETEAEVWFDRGRRSGAACIYGTRLPTAFIADIVDTQGVESARAAYDLTDEQVQGAVAFEKRYGSQAAVIERVESPLANDWEHDAAIHLTDYGQNLPCSVVVMAARLREALAPHPPAADTPRVPDESEGA